MDRICNVKSACKGINSKIIFVLIYLYNVKLYGNKMDFVKNAETEILFLDINASLNKFIIEDV